MKRVSQTLDYHFHPERRKAFLTRRNLVCCGCHPARPVEPAVKILSHDNYTFYDPRIQSDPAPDGASFILFEGTYTAQFADHARPTPRYNYDQIRYRLDLDDPQLTRNF